MRWYQAVGSIVIVLQLVASDLYDKDDDMWIWGPFPEERESNGPNKTLESHKDSCPPYEPPPMPNFNAAGRRISETKCYEYIWQMKIRAEETAHIYSCDIKRSTIYVIGGRVATFGEYPHMGAIGWKAVVDTWIFKCGSSLISNRFVLTAAHCSSASTLDSTIADITPKIVRFGVTISSNSFVKPQEVEVVDYKIDKIFVHPQYASPKQYFDIALMKLRTEVIFTKKIQPACLWNRFNVSMYGEKAEVAGWGIFQSGGVKTSPELLTAEVDFIDSEKCDRLLRPSCNRNWCGIMDHQLCAGKLDGGVDSCQGDSGGPLMVRINLPILSQGYMHYVIGVTSFGVGCGEPNLPGVYTRVPSFVDWIEKIVWS